MANADDYLAVLPVDKVAAWYGRLVKEVGKQKVQGMEPFSAVLLQKYLDNRDPNASYEFEARTYLQSSSYVLDTLRYHRDVFLTIKKARLGAGMFASKKWAGILPRFQGKSGFKQWTPGTPLKMSYESLVEVGGSLADIIRIQQFGSMEEKDLFTSLRGFQLKSEVLLSGLLSGNNLNVNFVNWYCSGTDTYDFNFNEHLTMPNPDYQKNYADAVKPDLEKIRVYHTNAERLEKAGLAAPYKVVIASWRVTEQTVLSSATLNANKSL